MNPYLGGRTVCKSPWTPRAVDDPRDVTCKVCLAGVVACGPLGLRRVAWVIDMLKLGEPAARGKFCQANAKR